MPTTQIPFYKRLSAKFRHRKMRSEPPLVHIRANEEHTLPYPYIDYSRTPVTNDLVGDATVDDGFILTAFHAPETPTSYYSANSEDPRIQSLIETLVQLEEENGIFARDALQHYSNLQGMRHSVKNNERIAESEGNQIREVEAAEKALQMRELALEAQRVWERQAVNVLDANEQFWMTLWDLRDVPEIMHRRFWIRGTLDAIFDEPHSYLVANLPALEGSIIPMLTYKRDRSVSRIKHVFWKRKSQICREDRQQADLVTPSSSDMTTASAEILEPDRRIALLKLMAERQKAYTKLSLNGPPIYKTLFSAFGSFSNSLSSIASTSSRTLATLGSSSWLAFRSRSADRSSTPSLAEDQSMEQSSSSSFSSLESIPNSTVRLTSAPKLQAIAPRRMIRFQSSSSWSAYNAIESDADDYPTSNSQPELIASIHQTIPSITISSSSASSIDHQRHASAGKSKRKSMIPRAVRRLSVKDSASLLSIPRD